MIVVKIELHSANTGEVTQLGEMHICNDGTGSNSSCHYDGRVLRKPDFKAVTRRGRVNSHQRLRDPVWHLVAKMLKNMGYLK